MTSNNANINANSSTAGSTYRSPASSKTTKISPIWAPPKSPLSPHRLAKLANALGVSTPMPATPQSTPYMSRSFLESPPTPDAFRQSPVPSPAGSSFNAYSPTVSRYLLHVIPPMHLPHDTDNDMTPPPASASGYHTQFRRGTLVPVHSNLQSQLAAIAKEYALPSTTGMILYLVSSVKSHQYSPTPEALVDEMDEPGPRLSEDIWRHLWTRVLKAEQRDDILMPPLESPLGMSLGTRSTPDLPQESNRQPLRPFLSSTVPPNFSSVHLPPSPTTPSTFSDFRSNAPPSESSANDPETPETSFAAPSIVKDPETRANSLDLPGLASPSIIPILAKVEFDIDRRKATWYEPWLRSRRLNHAKRAESRNGRQGDAGDNLDDPYEHPRHIGLLTGKKEAQSTVSVVLSSTEGILNVKPDAMLVPLPTSEGDQQLDEQEEDQDGNRWSEEVLPAEPDAMLLPLPTSEGYQHMEDQEEDRDESGRWSEEVLTVKLDAMPIPRPTSEGYRYIDEQEEDQDKGDGWSERVLTVESDVVSVILPSPTSDEDQQLDGQQEDRNEGGGSSEGVLTMGPDAMPVPLLKALDGYQQLDDDDEDRDEDNGWSEGDLTIKPDAMPAPLLTSEGYQQLDELEDDQDEDGEWSKGVLTVDDEATPVPLLNLTGDQQHDAQEEEDQNEDGRWPEGVLPVEPDAIPAPLPTPGGDGQEEDQDKGGGGSDDSDDDEFESTARVTMELENHEDALADVFGTDAETWAEMRISASGMSKHQTNPNIVDLALNAADLTALPSPTESEVETLGKEEDEVQALLDQMTRSTLSVSLPASPSETRSSLPAPGNKKHVPPPLTFVTNSPPRDLALPADSTPSSASSAGLAYLYDGDTSPGEDQEAKFETDYMSPGESMKREGVVFDDLDLGLDPTEDYDETDPNDRRHSQFLMMAQLDEIERTMAQLSPRVLQDDFADAQQPLSPRMILSSGKLNADFFPPSPRLHQHDEVPDSPLLKPDVAWSATPASIKNTPSPHQEDVPSTPPRLAITAFIPSSSGEMSEESQLQKRELKEEEEDYHRRPVLPPKPPIVADSGPIIPLSPDPFGRFSSTPPPLPGEQQSSAYWEKDAVPDISNISPVDISLPMDNSDRRKRSNSSATSRFSADSMTGIEGSSKSNRSTLMSVNTFRKLWRKSTKNVSSSNLTPFPSRSSVPAVPPVPTQASLGKSDETPKTPILGRFSSPSPPPRLSQDMLPPPVPQALLQQLSAPVMVQQSSAISQSTYASQPPQPPPEEELAPPVPPKPRSLLPHHQHLPLPSSDQQRPPLPHPSQKFRYPLPPQQEVMISQQSPVPPLFNGTSTNPQPIVATQMRPGRSNSTLDQFQFDQESPYPITARRIRANSRPLSPISSPDSPTTYLPPLTTTSASGSFSSIVQPHEKPNVRKSILKSSKSSSISSTASIQQQLLGISESGTNIERSNSNGTRPRHHSVLSLGSSRTSVTSLHPDIPPSPQIPQQFIPRNDKRQSIRSRLTNLSIDSSHSIPQLSIKTNGSASRRSMASSHSSQESRPSFDVSQFEMVSPKMGSTSSYTYHRVNHSMDSSVEERH